MPKAFKETHSLAYSVTAKFSNEIHIRTLHLRLKNKKEKEPHKQFCAQTHTHALQRLEKENSQGKPGKNYDWQHKYNQTVQAKTLTLKKDIIKPNKTMFKPFAKLRNKRIIKLLKFGLP